MKYASFIILIATIGSVVAWHTGFAVIWTPTSYRFVQCRTSPRVRVSADTSYDVSLCEDSSGIRRIDRTVYQAEGTSTAVVYPVRSSFGVFIGCDLEKVSCAADDSPRVAALVDAFEKASH